MVTAIASREETGPARPGLLDAHPASQSTRILAGLRSSGARRERAMAELHTLLLGAAHREVRRRRHWAPDLEFRDLDVVAREVADDALLDIGAKLGDFRGESRFTTWAYGFVVFKASARLSSESRRQAPVAMDDASWERLPDRLSAGPHQRAQQHEMRRVLRHAIEDDLTDRQRYVFVSVTLNDACPGELAAQLGSTRNAIYKVLFDARRNLQASLHAAGYRPAVCVRPSLTAA